jgi:ribosomal protein S18 acetylase RimI-like enzyme
VIGSRGYRSPEDLEALRRMLIETFEINQTMHNWWIDRFESGTYFQPGEDGWTSGLQLWHDDSKLVGAVHPRSGAPNEAYIQIYPDYRHLEPEMIQWAENNLHGGESLSFWVFEFDAKRQRILESRGYERTGRYGYERWRSLSEPIPEMELPEGYVLRPLDREGDADLMADAINAAFGRTFHTGEWYRRVQSAPSYRCDLDLAAIAPNGAIASFATAWHHPRNDIGAFEPVGTHPDHRRLSLARSIIHEGLRRLRELGANRVKVGTGMNPAANSLYESLGFTRYERNHEYRGKKP